MNGRPGSKVARVHIGYGWYRSSGVNETEAWWTELLQYRRRIFMSRLCYSKNVL